MNYPRIMVAVAVIALIIAALSLKSCNDMKVARMALERESEAKDARLNGQLVAEQEIGKKLNARVQELEIADISLRDQLKRSNAIAKSTTVELYQLRSQITRVGPNPDRGSAIAICKLSEGDQVQFRVVILGKRTDRGNLFVNGNVAVDKLVKEGTEEIAKADFDSKLSNVIELNPPERVEKLRKWAYRGGAKWSRVSATPTGAFLGIDRRLFGRLWLTMQGDHDIHLGPSMEIGVRWDGP